MPGLYTKEMRSDICIGMLKHNILMDKVENIRMNILNSIHLDSLDSLFASPFKDVIFVLAYKDCIGGGLRSRIR